MKKEFNRNDLAAIKRAAASIAPLAAKRDKLLMKRMELQKQIDEIQGRINLYNMPINEMTGYNAEDLVDKRVDGTYVLKYPETIIPDLIHEAADSAEVIDETAVVDEVETTPADAPINLPY